MTPEIYVSTDIEADGPLPGDYSMLAIGSAAFTADGTMIDSFSANLEPLAGARADPAVMAWWDEHPEAWAAVCVDRQPADAVMDRYVRWVGELPGTPIFVGYPAGYDFVFVYWYLMRFVGMSPFRRTALDIRTYAMAVLGANYRDCAREDLPTRWLPAAGHSHVALDDAIEQGQIFCAILQERNADSRWEGVTMTTGSDQATSVRAKIAESAARVGVQLDEAELERWMTAVATTSEGDDIVIDEETGVFGHRISMLDFSPADLARFRAIGKIVEFADVPGVVETALALSGSAAQSKMQTYPGDCDYFERVNIIAPTRVDACRIVAQLIRDKATAFLTGDGYQLIEVKFGSYPMDVTRGERTHAKGSPIAWLPAEIQAGQIEATSATGDPVVIRWDEVGDDPGWCKLDWLVADAQRGSLANASNMIDATWEAPDGTITPLDGYLDGYFQEIYLDAESAPIFNKLVKQMSTDSMAEYIAQLEHEVRKYMSPDYPNYGKAAKRLYNVFRLSGRYEEAAFLRELFDEPTALLYQVYALIKTVEEAAVKSEVFDIDNILDQTDELIMSVVKVLEGEEELEIVRHLLHLHRGLSRHTQGTPLGPQVEAAQAEVLNIVNNFFYEKMTAYPGIKAYMEDFTAQPTS